MLNDDAGLHEVSTVVDKHRKALQGPDTRELTEVCWRIGSKQPQLKRDRVLVERNQSLLTIGRERVRIENSFHCKHVPPACDDGERGHAQFLPMLRSRREIARSALSEGSHAFDLGLKGQAKRTGEAPAGLPAAASPMSRTHSCKLSTPLPM